MARKYEIPIYATAGTIAAMKDCKGLGSVDHGLFHEVKEDTKFTIKDLTINPMRISHDAAQPVGYRISYGNRRVAVCTDLGVYNDYTVECLKGMDALLLHSFSHYHRRRHLAAPCHPDIEIPRLVGIVPHIDLHPHGLKWTPAPPGSLSGIWRRR